MKIKSLVLSGSGVKRKFLWSFNILWKLHACKNSSSDLSYDRKSSWSIRFEYYLVMNGLTSDFDFLLETWTFKFARRER